MTKFLSFGLTLTLLAMSVTNILADQITLKNGDRLTGKVIKQDDKELVLQTEFAGLITISKSNIEKILREAVYQEEEKAVIEKLTETKTEPVKTDEETTATAAATVTAPKQLGFTEGWEGAANVGFSLTSGNSKTNTLTAGVRAEKSGENDKWTFYTNALRSRNRVGLVNVTTSNAIWGGLRYDRNITKKVFAFGLYDYERDIPQSLKYRSVVGGGLGYHAIKNDQTELDFFGGAAWNKTWFTTGLTRSSAEVLVGNTLKHKLNDRVKFQQGFTFYPNLTQTGEYRFVFDSTLSADLTKRFGLFVTVADRFNSLPLAGVEKNDFLFATGLKVSFGKTK